MAQTSSALLSPAPPSNSLLQKSLGKGYVVHCSVQCGWPPKPPSLASVPLLRQQPPPLPCLGAAVLQSQQTGSSRWWGSSNPASKSRQRGRRCSEALGGERGWLPLSKVATPLRAGEGFTEVSSKQMAPEGPGSSVQHMLQIIGRQSQAWKGLP